MSEITELLHTLKKLNARVLVNNTSYVHYDKATGEIKKISSRSGDLTEGLEILEVAHEQVQDLITGIRRTEDFEVAYDVSLKQNVLREKVYENVLENVSQRLYELPIMNIVFDKLGSKRPMSFEQIYDGVTVYIWDNNTFYKEKQIIWHNNCVWKAKYDIEPSIDFPLNDFDLYIEDVVLTDVRTISQKLITREIGQESAYEGVYIDVFYKELSHVKGQHVWHNNSVYMFTKDRKANTPFSRSSKKLIVSDVLLVDDENKYLDFYDKKKLLPGDLILDNNFLYLIKLKEHLEDINNIIIYYINEKIQVIIDGVTHESSLFEYENGTTQIDLDKDSIKVSSYNKLPLVRNEDLEDGQKVLIENKLYIASPIQNLKHDISVCQNKIENKWYVYLNRDTKRELIKSGFRSNDIIYFSVTAKHDPNILYKTMEFKVKDLLSNRIREYPFQESWESDGTEVSIYTSKFFESYAHEIIQ